MELLTTQEFLLAHPGGTGRDDEMVTGDIRYIDDGRPKPLMLISHGYKTHKDWGFFPHIGEYFAAQGIVTVVINFARNGVKAGEKEITDWNIFAKLTPTSEIDDLHLILDAVHEGALEYYGIDIDGTARVLLGHSSGGSVSVITASERTDVGGLILYSPPSTFDRVTPEEKKRWRERGELELQGDPEYGTIRIGIEPLDDIENNAKRLNVVGALDNLNIPVFIAQGDEDPTVALNEAEILYSAVKNNESHFFKMPGADHLYGVEHPYYPGSSKHLNELIRETNDWLKRVIK